MLNQLQRIGQNTLLNFTLERTHTNGETADSVPAAHHTRYRGGRS